ncbi:MAG: alpha-galactosidase [Victivallales bacterium]|nr:alpha-galactosidase [Victivallales bacterium]
MSISYQEQERIFVLQTPHTTYAMQLAASGHLRHLYWGKKLEQALPDGLYVPRNRSFSPWMADDPESMSLLDSASFEYPVFGCGDFRIPALELRLANGTSASDLRYREHRIQSGKPGLPGLPATYVEDEAEAETLTVVLIDAVAGLEVELAYTAFRDHDAIARSVRVRNVSDAALRLEKIASAAVDLERADFDLIQLSGAWARERHLMRTPLRSGLQSLSSCRGASGHMQHPFVALADRRTGEESGEVYGMSLVYSGNFAAEIEVDQEDNTRVAMGINPFDFEWLLEPGEVFQAPETVMVFSDAGLGDMSRTYHRLYRERLCRGRYRDSDRYILINNWEATYFDFNEALITSLAHEAKELGVELFVLDDGWFGKRDGDNSSLGDWYPDPKKLPHGITGLAEKITAQGMKFGLWFEPEMVSPDSDLYRAHPDWCIHVPARSRSLGRNQLILDYSRRDVCDAIVAMLSEILGTAPISYVKWDMNRHMTEPGSAQLPPERQREVGHRYILGLYEVMETLTSRFPDILFESCSGGGGRFDPGMLYYMPQTWTSDNSDAISRLKIQYGTSMVYPASAMGAHVSAVPNHQHGRVTSLETRGHCAMSGNFGYELDVRKMTAEEKAMVREQIRRYKEIRHTVLFGDLYRLKSPFESNEAAWNYVSRDRKEVVVMAFYILAEADAKERRLRLGGLDPVRKYRVAATGEEYYGEFLMNYGLTLPAWTQGDFKSTFWHLLAVE